MKTKFPLSNLHYLNSDGKSLQKYLQHAMEQNLNPKIEIQSISNNEDDPKPGTNSQEVDFAIVDYFISQIGMVDLKKNNPHLYQQCLIKKMLMQSEILNQQGNDKVSSVFLEKAYRLSEKLELFSDHSRAIQLMEKFKSQIWNREEIAKLHQLRKSLLHKQFTLDSANRKIDWIEAHLNEIKNRKYIRLYLESLEEHLKKKRKSMNSQRYKFLCMLVSSYRKYASNEREQAFEKLKKAQKLIRSNQEFFSDDEQFRTLLMRIRCMIQNENVYHLDRFILKMLFSQRLSFHLKGKLICMLTDYLFKHEEPLLANTVLRQINILKEKSDLFQSPKYLWMQAQLLYRCHHFEICLQTLQMIPTEELSQLVSEKFEQLKEQCVLKLKLSMQSAATSVRVSSPYGNTFNLNDTSFTGQNKRPELPNN